MLTIHKTNELVGDIILTINKNTDLSQYTFIQDKAYATRKAASETNEIVILPNGSHTLILVVFNQKDTDFNFSLEELRRLGSKVVGLLNSEKVEQATLSNAALEKSECIAFIEGIALSNYQFLKFKSDKKQNSFGRLDVKAELNEDELNEITNLTEAVFFTRDMVNEPVISMNTQGFSQYMIKGGEKAGYSTKVLSKAEIEALKMGGLLGVNLGSIDDPAFNILEWKPEQHVNERPLILVGKGVVYDTGGYNIKTGSYMAGMKCDMGGGAAVTGAIYAIAKNKLPLWTITLVPATDNRIGKNALVADDVITMSDGTTVEVKNTDAEGRLILADALVYAKQYDPELVIDLATLTGAADAITGPYGSVLVHDAKTEQVNALKEAGETSYERLAEMPFWREYNDLLKSNIADISNLGGPKGGAITAGKFLHHFTDYNWIHLDIAGPSFLDTTDYYKTEGGTGVGTRLLYLYAKNRCLKQ